MNKKELAESMGFSSTMIKAYESLINTTMPFKNSEIAELDIIYFLDNTLWSSNFELVAKIIIESGNESTLAQWVEAVKEEKINREG